jgi:hypothetical protein
MQVGRAKGVDGGRDPFDFAQGRLSLRMTAVKVSVVLEVFEVS